MVVDPVYEPETPLMVTVTGPPVVAVPVAVRVMTCVPARVPAAKAAVTPLGRPAALKVAVPEKPPISLTVMVSVAVLPWATETLVGEGVRPKPGEAPFTVTVWVLLD